MPESHNTIPQPGPDQRVTSAREYLTSARQHKVTALPPSVLVRECAELRRQLGQVLDVIGQADDEVRGSRTGQLLATMAAVAARFIEVPRPHIDKALPSAEYVAAHDRAAGQFTQLQRDQAIRLAAHLEWLAREDDTPLGRRIEIITGMMAAELAVPLPYPVKPETQS